MTLCVFNGFSQPTVWLEGYGITWVTPTTPEQLNQLFSNLKIRIDGVEQSFNDDTITKTLTSSHVIVDVSLLANLIEIGSKTPFLVSEPI